MNPIRSRSVHLRLYLLNTALLATHEIDSAYWKEWDLFGIGGGIEDFLVINFVLVAAVLYGLTRLADGFRSGIVFSVLLSAAGIFAFVIHMVFLMTGHAEFSNSISIGLLSCILAVSAVQLLFAVRSLRSGKENP